MNFKYRWMPKQWLRNISGAFSIGDYYIGRPLPTLHKYIPNHLTGDACRTIELSNRRIPTSAGSSRTSTLAHEGPGHLSSKQA